MSNRIRFVIPACIVLLSVLLFGYLNVMALHAAGNSVAAQRSYATDQHEQSENRLSSEHSEKAHPVSDTAYDQYAELKNSDGFYEIGDSGYVLTEEERELVERAVACEAGGEGLRGEMMVAQSILDGSLRHNYSISETIDAYSVATTAYRNVSDEVREAVRRVFDQGQRITMEKTDLWYNPAMVVSLWHEEQQYVITVGSHRFFWMNDEI